MADDLRVGVEAVGLAEGETLGAASPGLDGFPEPAARAVQALREVGHVRLPVLVKGREERLIAKPGIWQIVGYLPQHVGGQTRA